MRTKNFEARNGRYETSAVFKNQGATQREQRGQGECWQWKGNGQCSKGDNCSFRHDTNKRAKSSQPNPSPESSTQQTVKKKQREPRVPEAEAQLVKWLVCRARITSKELVQLHSVKNGILRSACSTSKKKDANLGTSALMHTARLANSLARSLKRVVTKLLWLY